MYESGLSFINTVTSGLGAGFGGLAGGAARTSGTQVSGISAKAAPPKKRSVGRPVFGTVVSLVLGLTASYYFLVLAGLAGFMAFRNIAYNRSTFPQAYATWDALYMCHRCGAFTKPTLVNPQLVAQAPPSVTTIDHPSLPGTSAS